MLYLFYYFVHLRLQGSRDLCLYNRFLDKVTGVHYCYIGHRMRRIVINSGIRHLQSFSSCLSSDEYTSDTSDQYNILIGDVSVLPFLPCWELPSALLYLPTSLTYAGVCTWPHRVSLFSLKPRVCKIKLFKMQIEFCFRPLIDILLGTSSLLLSQFLLILFRASKSLQE